MHFHRIQDLGKQKTRSKDHKNLSRGCGMRFIIVNIWCWWLSRTSSWLVKTFYGELNSPDRFCLCNILGCRIRWETKENNYIRQVRVCSPGCVTKTSWGIGTRVAGITDWTHHIGITDHWYVMTTSSNGNIFRVTDPLCGVFTGHRWIPLTKASDAELWCFPWSAPEHMIEKAIVMPVIWDAIVLIMTSL